MRSSFARSTTAWVSGSEPLFCTTISMSSDGCAHRVASACVSVSGRRSVGSTSENRGIVALEYSRSVDVTRCPVVILCGGRGTRLREETEYKPKPMVEVGGKPILWHVMRTFARGGFRELIVCLG